ncbi:MAG TPA: glycosyltransferase family 4 protein [Syntrophobacteria bacterium]|nr:glycosyltransferase family 4 protein [Syntrophobacteria bacterium]
MPKEHEVKVCLASQHFFPTPGGAQLRFLRYLPGLRARGIYVQVLAGTPATKKLIASEVPKEWLSRPIGEFLPTESVNGTPIHRVRLPEEKGLLRTRIFCQALVDFCKQPGCRPDVVQLLGSLPPRTLPWMLRLRARRIPTVYAFTSPPNLPANPLKRIRRRLFYRLLYRQLSCIVSVSTTMRRLVLDIGTGARIEIIPSGVDLQRFHPAQSADGGRALRASLRIADKDVVITTVGSLIPRKGSDLLLEAWAKLAQRFPRTHVVIIGPLFGVSHPILGEFRRKVDDLILASGAPARVHLTGFVENVEDFLRASDLFVLPSVEEGVPGAVLEAMASGAPAMVTSFVGLPEELGKPGQEYLLVERNPEALADAIAAVLEDEHLRRRLGRQGRKWVETTMDVEGSLDRYAALYHELADRSRRGRPVAQ